MPVLHRHGARPRRPPLPTKSLSRPHPSSVTIAWKTRGSEVRKLNQASRLQDLTWKVQDLRRWRSSASISTSQSTRSAARPLRAAPRLPALQPGVNSDGARGSSSRLDRKIDRLQRGRPAHLSGRSMWADAVHRDGRLDLLDIVTKCGREDSLWLLEVGRPSRYKMPARPSTGDRRQGCEEGEQPP